MLLHKSAADVSKRTAAGSTCLHLSARSGNREIVDLLIAHKVNPIILDNENMTASQVAYAVRNI